MKISKEVKIGLLISIAIACFIWGLNFLKGKDLFTLRTQYFAVYDNVDGLVSSNPVTINGMVVGKVNKIFFHPNLSGKLIVHIIMDNTELSLPKNTVAAIISTGLLGGKGVELRLGNAKEFAKTTDTLLSFLDKGLMGQLDPIKTKSENLMASIDSVMQVMQSIFNNDTKNNITETIRNFKNTSATLDNLLATEKVKLAKITQNVESITANLKDNNKQLTNILTNFSAISDSLAKSNLLATIDNANKAVKQTSEIVEKINSGKGSIGMLVHNDTLYRNLESSSKNLDLLVEDLRLHPKRYVHLSVFGKKEKPFSNDGKAENKKK